MKIPKHVAIIMDGNGRWAKAKGLSRKEGHRAGVDALERTTRKAGELGISALTVYTFSTENWKRPGSEVKFLLNLFSLNVKEKLPMLMENNVQVKIIGRKTDLSGSLLKAIRGLENQTAANTGLRLNIAFNYGGRAEILDMVNKVAEMVKAGEIEIEDLEENDLNRFLYTPDYPEVELVIRTGGDKRLSNFLLWQSAYAELYFLEKFWPDFTGEDLDKAIETFQSRERRFGSLNSV